MKREGDGPTAIEPDEDDAELVVGQHYQVLLMARGRCRCIVQVRVCTTDLRIPAIFDNK